MGKFDINAQLTNESKLTKYDLCKDIHNEIDSSYSFNDIMFKLKSPQGSGLIDKLKKHLNFDIEKMEKVSTTEKFDTLKLLKELFSIEKDGLPKYVNDYELTANIRIHIIDILKKPRLSNIKSYYGNGTQYGEILEKLFDNIKSNVPDAYERISKIEKIDSHWQYLAQKQFDYVFSDMALANMDNSLKELQRINKTLESIFYKLDKLDINEINLHTSTEGVMKTFFNILLAHNQLCYEIDRIKANEYVNLDLCPNAEYTKLFKKFENELLEVQAVSELNKAIGCKNKSDNLNKIFNLISYCEEIPMEDYKHYRYAFNHFRTVLNWLMKEKDGADFSDKVPLAILVSIIQEIVYVKKNHNNFVIRNDFYGYNANGTSLLSSLKKNEDDVDSLLIHIWIRRVETRFSINYGAHDLIIEKNKAELLMFKIKEILYGYNNLNDLEQANAYVLHIIDIAHSNHNIAADKEIIFKTYLTQYLKRCEIIIEQCVLPDDPQNIYNMFIELLSTYDPVEANVYINGLAEQVADTIAKKGTSEATTYTFIIKKHDDNYRKCYLDFKCDKTEKKFFYKKFGFIYSDDEKKTINQLGLKNLIL